MCLDDNNESEKKIAKPHNKLTLLINVTFLRLVSLAGLEPATLELEVPCSVQLSYRDLYQINMNSAIYPVINPTGHRKIPRAWNHQKTPS